MPFDLSSGTHFQAVVEELNFELGGEFPCLRLASIHEVDIYGFSRGIQFQGVSGSQKEKLPISYSYAYKATSSTTETLPLA